MVNSKKLISMARKWNRFVAEKKKKRISLPRRIAKQGCFVVYTVDEKRFELPLEFLRSNMFEKLLKMSEVEFGLPSDGPIKLPCESFMLEHVVSFVGSGDNLGEDLYKALLTASICHSYHTSAPFFLNDIQQTYNQMLILGF